MFKIPDDLFIPSEKDGPGRVNHWATWTCNKLIMGRHDLIRKNHYRTPKDKRKVVQDSVLIWLPQGAVFMADS